MVNANNYRSVPSVAKNILYKVYAFMAGALLITAAVALYVANQPTLIQKLVTNPWLLLFLFMLQLAIVIILLAAILKLNFATAFILLILYAILMGITFSTIFLLYNIGTIYTAFFVTAGMFFCMALYGYFTKTDLTNVGKYSIMALFGLIIGMVVNIFLKNGTVDYIITLAGIIVFTLLTAYDVQKIKKVSEFLIGQGELENKIAILGALTLYLDFINLFLMLLRLFGRRGNE